MHFFLWIFPKIRKLFIKLPNLASIVCHLLSLRYRRMFWIASKAAYFSFNFFFFLFNFQLLMFSICSRNRLKEELTFYSKLSNRKKVCACIFISWISYFLFSSWNEILFQFVIVLSLYGSLFHVWWCTFCSLCWDWEKNRREKVFGSFKFYAFTSKLIIISKHKLKVHQQLNATLTILYNFK